MLHESDKELEITSIDISKSSCEKLKQEIGENEKIKIKEEDVFEMKYENEFELVIEKGLMDSFWLDTNTLDANKIKTLENIVYNSLKKDGFWVIFTINNLIKEKIFDKNTKIKWEGGIQVSKFKSNILKIYCYRLIK
jgi:hypothetical protein